MKITTKLLLYKKCISLRKKTEMPRPKRNVKPPERFTVEVDGKLEDDLSVDSDFDENESIDSDEDLFESEEEEEDDNEYEYDDFLRPDDEIEEESSEDEESSYVDSDEDDEEEDDDMDSEDDEEEASTFDTLLRAFYDVGSDDECEVFESILNVCELSKLDYSSLIDAPVDVLKQITVKCMGGEVEIDEKYAKIGNKIVGLHKMYQELSK